MVIQVTLFEQRRVAQREQHCLDGIELRVNRASDALGAFH
jgi:hypothetical protein